MRTVATLIRLRWALTVNSWRKSTATLVLSILGALYFGGLALMVVVSLLLGLPGVDHGVRAAVTIGAASGVVLAWAVLPPVLTGVDATLDPRSFQMFPLRRVPLVTGLAVGALTTPIGVCTLLVLLGVAASWWDVPGALPVALVGAGVTAVTAVCLGYGLTGLLSAYTGQRRVREVISLVLFVPLMLGGILISQAVESLAQIASVLPAVAEALAWTPLGAGLGAGSAAAGGSFGLAAVRLLVALGWCAGAVWLWTLALRRIVEPVTVVGARTRTAGVSESRPLRWLGRPAAGPVTAIAARCQVYWLKDPRYSASLVALPLLAVMMVWFSQSAAGPGAMLLFFLPPLVAWSLGFAISADIAYDNTAFHLHMVSAVAGVHDRAGRALAVAPGGVGATLVTSLFAAGLADAWHHLPALLGFSLGTFAVMLGLASFVSARFVYPVQKPGESPFATPQGSMMRTALVQVATMAVSALLTLPMLGLAVAYAVTQAAWLGWATGVFCLLWGAAALWLGIRLGGRWLDRCQAETFQAVQSF